MSQECLSVKGWHNPNKTVIYTQKFTKILSVKQNLDLSGQNQLDLVIFSRTPFLWECSYIFKLAYSPFIRGGGSQFCAEILAWSVPAGKWISSWEININGKNKLGCLSHLKMFFFPLIFLISMQSLGLTSFIFVCRHVAMFVKHDQKCCREFAEPKNSKTFFSMSIFISKNLPAANKNGRKYVENVLDFSFIPVCKDWCLFSSSFYLQSCFVLFKWVHTSFKCPILPYSLI